MAIGEAEVRHIARLARLRLSEEEVAAFTRQLNDILAHVEKLRGADAEARSGGEGAEPAPLADDVVAPDPLAFPPAALAPAFEEGFFTLPRLASHDTDAGEEG